MSNFNDAKPGEFGWVYRCPPGDEHGWVTDPEWWDDIDDPVKTTRQRWQLIEQETVVFHPRTELCPTCTGEGGDHATGDTCDTCGGDGGHPLAGHMEIIGGNP